MFHNWNFNISSNFFASFLNNPICVAVCGMLKMEILMQFPLLWHDVWVEKGAAENCFENQLMIALVNKGEKQVEWFQVGQQTSQHQPTLSAVKSVTSIYVVDDCLASGFTCQLS